MTCCVYVGMNDTNSNNRANHPRNDSTEPVANLAMEYCELLQQHGKELPGHSVQDYLDRIQPSLHSEFLELINLDLLVQAVEGSLLEDVQKNLAKLEERGLETDSSSAEPCLDSKEGLQDEPVTSLPELGDPPVQLPRLEAGV